MPTKQIKIVAQAESKSAEVYLYDVIGEDMFGGVSAKNFADQLDAVGPLDTITVRINSPGGSVFDGTAIYNTLKRNQARKIVEIEGVAASAASFIAMAGDEIHMAENAFMMIHQAQGFAMGPESEMRKMADVLDKMDETIAKIYANRSGRKPDTMMRMMVDETWFTAQEAVDAKLADNIRANKGKPSATNLAALNLISKRPERIAAIFEHGLPGSTADAEALEKSIDMAYEQTVAIDEPQVDVASKLAEYQARIAAISEAAK